MKGYKSINQFNLQECDVFLQSHPNSPFHKEVRRRRVVLVEKREREEERNREIRLAERKAEEEAQRRSRIKIWIWLITTIVIGVSVLLVVIHSNIKDTANRIPKNYNENKEYGSNTISEVILDSSEETDVVYTAVEEASTSAYGKSTSDVVKTLISTYCDAISSGKLDCLRELYAYSIERYHSKHNTNIDYVINAHNKYDEKFGVYGKRFIVRWQTLELNEMGNGKNIHISVIIDYHIDRYDSSKKSDFVLRKHFVLNDDKKIIEEYDDIIESY